MQPLGTRVLIERELPSEKIGSLFVPARARRPPQEGKILAVGPQVTTVKVGDVVLFGRHSGIELDHPGFILLWEADLMAVLNDVDP
jgi:chaperonin GroES